MIKRKMLIGKRKNKIHRIKKGQAYSSLIGRKIFSPDYSYIIITKMWTLSGSLPHLDHENTNRFQVAEFLTENGIKYKMPLYCFINGCTEQDGSELREKKWRLV